MIKPILLLFSVLNSVYVRSTYVTWEYCNGGNVLQNINYESGECLRSNNDIYSHIITCSDDNTKAKLDYYNNSYCFGEPTISISNDYVFVNECFLAQKLLNCSVNYNITCYTDYNK
jgi:hypothetical protein